MAPRLSKTAGTETTPIVQEGTPKFEAGVQGHQFGTQFAFDVNKQMGKLEVCLDHVEKRLEKLENKVEEAQRDVAVIKTTLDALKPLAKSVGRGVWAVFILLATFGLSVLGFWLKHKMGW